VFFSQWPWNNILNPCLWIVRAKSSYTVVEGCIQKFPDWVDKPIYTLTAINTLWEATQRFMAAKLTILAHKIAIQMRLAAESCTICSPHSRRPVRKLMDTPLCVVYLYCCAHEWSRDIGVWELASHLNKTIRAKRVPATKIRFRLPKAKHHNISVYHRKITICVCVELERSFQKQTHHKHKHRNSGVENGKSWRKLLHLIGWCTFYVNQTVIVGCKLHFMSWSILFRNSSPRFIVFLENM
jgi:hypothetical protein